MDPPGQKRPKRLFCGTSEPKSDRTASFQTRKEREIQQQMLSQDEETVELRETFTSLQQEVEVKTKKLKKVNGAV